MVGKAREWICLALDHVLLTTAIKRRLEKPALEQMVRKGLSEEVTFNMIPKDDLRQSTLIRIH